MIQSVTRHKTSPAALAAIFFYDLQSSIIYFTVDVIGTAEQHLAKRYRNTREVIGRVSTFYM